MSNFKGTTRISSLSFYQWQVELRFTLPGAVRGCFRQSFIFQPTMPAVGEPSWLLWPPTVLIAPTHPGPDGMVIWQTKKWTPSDSL